MIFSRDYTHEMFDLLEVRKVGAWSIEKTTIPAGTRLRTYRHGRGIIFDTVADDFPVVRLRQGTENLWMSDTPFEQETMKYPLREAKGDVLICGLGIGMLAHLLAKKLAVQEITIIELNEEVVGLVYDKIVTPKMRLLLQDAREFLVTSHERFDFIDIDIWADITNPYHEIEQFTNAAKKLLKPGGKVHCWLEEHWNVIRVQLKGKQIVPGGFVAGPPCLACGKMPRFDYAGFCMDCADGLEISELFQRSVTK